MAAIPDPVQTAYETAAAQRTLSLPTIPEELRALEADALRGGADEPLEAIAASGLIIAAKNDMAHLALAQQLQDHSLYREYEAVVVGNLREDQGTISLPIARHPTASYSR